jgi:nucleoside-diphosphate-sugar epimerase
MKGPIALTGATGFVGRRVMAQVMAQDMAQDMAVCAEAGTEIRILARRPADLEPMWRARCIVIEGDILDHTALERLTAGAASVIHCAGAIAARRDDTFASVNVEGTRRLAAAARQGGTLRFVHVSSLAAREPGLSAYALSKRLGEREVMDGLASDRWVIVRPPVVYGPGDVATLPLMAQLTQRTAWLPGSRQQRFSLLYADDLARALIQLAETPEPCGTILELHDGQPEGYAWADIAATAAKFQGQAVQVRHLPRMVLAGLSRLSLAWTRATGHRLGPEISPGKVRELYHRDWVCRNNLLDQTTPWRADLRFEDGFARTLEWYRHNGWLPPGHGVAKTQARSDHGVAAK